MKVSVFLFFIVSNNFSWYKSKTLLVETEIKGKERSFKPEPKKTFLFNISSPKSQDYIANDEEGFVVAQKIHERAVMRLREYLLGNRSWRAMRVVTEEVPLKCRMDGCHTPKLCKKCQKYWMKVLRRISNGTDYYCPVYLDILDRCEWMLFIYWNKCMNGVANLYFPFNFIFDENRRRGWKYKIWFGKPV